MGLSTKVWGHRGCRGAANPPENSVPAFNAAIEQGAHGIELDVFLSEDNELVVFHDDTLERMSDGCGAISSLTLAQIKKLRLKDGEGQPSGVEIPTLEEVLDAVDRFRIGHPTERRVEDFTVDIEIKEIPGKDIARPVAREIGKRLARGWKRCNFQVSSFDIGALKRLKAINPDIPRGALFHGGQEPWDITPAQLVEHSAEIRDVRPQTVNITLPSITAEAVGKILQADASAKIVAWTYNETDPCHLPDASKHAMTDALDRCGVAAIITDYPKQMLDLLKSGS
jgi:glycerophosphoryl diester phosphodiesterase